MPTIPPGIDSVPASQVATTWSQNWFMNFIRTWLRPADVRNAIAGPGISITGNGTEVATISTVPEETLIISNPNNGVNLKNWGFTTSYTDETGGSSLVGLILNDDGSNPTHPNFYEKNQWLIVDSDNTQTINYIAIGQTQEYSGSSDANYIDMFCDGGMGISGFVYQFVPIAGQPAGIGLSTVDNTSQAKLVFANGAGGNPTWEFGVNSGTAGTQPWYVFDDLNVQTVIQINPGADHVMRAGNGTFTLEPAVSSGVNTTVVFNTTDHTQQVALCFNDIATSTGMWQIGVLAGTPGQREFFLYDGINATPVIAAIPNGTLGLTPATGVVIGNAAGGGQGYGIINAEGYAASGSNGISATITTAKLTGGGTQGSMTFTNGLLTAQVQAT